MKNQGPFLAQSSGQGSLAALGISPFDIAQGDTALALLDSWIALSEDESRNAAVADSYDDVATKSEKAGVSTFSS